MVVGLEGRPLDDVGRDTLGSSPTGRVVPGFGGADVVLFRGVWVLYVVSWGRRRFGSRSGRGNGLLGRELVFVLVLENPRGDEFLLVEEVEVGSGVGSKGTECFL